MRPYARFFMEGLHPPINLFSSHHHQYTGRRPSSRRSSRRSARSTTPSCGHSSVEWHPSNHPTHPTARTAAWTSRTCWASRLRRAGRRRRKRCARFCPGSGRTRVTAIVYGLNPFRSTIPNPQQEKELTFSALVSDMWLRVSPATAMRAFPSSPDHDPPIPPHMPSTARPPGPRLPGPADHAGAGRHRALLRPRAAPDHLLLGARRAAGLVGGVCVCVVYLG